ncbi:MAG: hypothetical protein WCA23_30935 [Stellaceae bacterium]
MGKRDANRARPATAPRRPPPPTNHQQLPADQPTIPRPTALAGWIPCYQSGRRHERAETERFRRFARGELVARDKLNLDIFWLKDEPLDDPNLSPPPDEIAAEIVENLEAVLDRFRKIARAYNLDDLKLTMMAC